MLFHSSLLLVLATNLPSCHGAFASFGVKHSSTSASIILSPRLDSSSWRLSQVGSPIPSWSVYDGTMVMPTSSEEETTIQEAADGAGIAVVDMSEFTSAFQGLAGPSKAGLVLAFLLAGGMAYASPNMELASDLKLVLSQFSTGEIGVDFSILATKLQSLDFGASTASSISFDNMNLPQLQWDGLKEPLMEQQVIWSSKLQTVSGQVQDFAASMWMQIQTQSSQLAKTIENAMPYQTADQFFAQVDEVSAAPLHDAEVMFATSMDHVNVALQDMGVQAQNSLSRLSSQGQDMMLQTKNDLELAYSQMQDWMGVKSSEVQNTVLPAVNGAMNQMQDTISAKTSEMQSSVPKLTEDVNRIISSMSSQMQDTISVKTSEMQSSMPKMTTEDMNSAMTSMSTQLQDTVASKTSQLQDTMSTKASEVQMSIPQVNEAVSAKVANFKTSLPQVNEMKEMIAVKTTTSVAIPQQVVQEATAISVKTAPVEVVVRAASATVAQDIPSKADQYDQLLQMLLQ